MMVRIYDRFPEARPAELSREQLVEFMGTTIWPVAEHFWGDSYRDQGALDNNEPVERVIKSIDGKNKLELRFYVDAEFPVTDSGDIDEDTPEDMFVALAVESLRLDLTRIYQKKHDEEVEIWESLTYSFSWDDEPPLAERYFFIKRAGEEVDADKTTRKQSQFLQNISRLSKYKPDRDPELNTQDISDIRLILLELPVPEGVITG